MSLDTGVSRRAFHFAYLLVSLVPAAGCSERESSVGESLFANLEAIMPVVRAEGSVALMEHSSTAHRQAPQFTVELTPLSIVGGGSGDPQFDLTGASYVVGLSDGRVMTFGPLGNMVFVFSRDGRGERTIGRTGHGPGDWMRFGDPVLLANDTVLVLDFGNNRLNWVTADGGVERTAPYMAREHVRGMSHVSGVLPSGELVMHSAGTWGGHQTDGQQRSLARIFATSLTTSQARFIATVPDIQGVQYETRYRGQARTDWHPLRLAGYAQVSVWDSVIVSATAESSALEIRDLSGAVRAHLRLGVSRRPVNGRMRTAQIAEELRRFDASRSERMVDPDEARRIAREAPFADSLPYFEKLIPGDSGTLWVVHAIAPGDTGWTATAVRKDGAIVAFLQVLGNSRPIAFRDGRVILRVQDENEVVSYRVHRLTRAEGQQDAHRPK